MRKIYFWCSLTHSSEQFKKDIEDYKNKFRNNFEMLDFVGLIGWTAKDVFDINVDHVKNCDFMIAECSHPSIWLWFELWLAYQLNKKIILLYQKDIKITRMILWMYWPNVVHVVYENFVDTYDEVLSKLE